jgi:hypothetical protein
VPQVVLMIFEAIQQMTNQQTLSSSPSPGKR